jgi:hypothetical protein
MRSPREALSFGVLSLSIVAACDNVTTGLARQEGGMDASIDRYELAEDGADSTPADAARPPQQGDESKPLAESSDESPEDSSSPEDGSSSEDSTTDAVSDSVRDQSSDGLPSDSPGAQDSTNVAPGSLKPTAIAPSHLRLWLNAEIGITCMSSTPNDAAAPGRVVVWADQSGHHDDASLTQVPQQLGPQCRVAGHRVKSVDLPYFSAPQNGNVVDETLDVDLTFLKGSDYTIFVVERRWADYGADASSQSEFVVGTTMPLTVEMAGFSNWCNPNPANELVAIGYSYYTGGPQLLLSQGCGPIGNTIGAVPTTPPSLLAEETGRLDQAAGRELWVNGSPFAADINTSPLSYAGGGAIGRAVAVTTAFGSDNRFRGDVAEVVVYDAALSDADRTTVEAYLQAHWSY